MASNILGQILASLLELRDVLAQPGINANLEVLRRDIDRLIGTVEAELGREIPATAYQRYERLKTIEPAFDSLNRKWSELRDEVAAHAAEELRGGLNLESGWKERWGPLFNVAWELRRTARPASTAARTRVRDSARPLGLPSDRRRPASDPSIVLDLRYAGGLALAQIGDLVGLSPAAVQLRVFEFEDAVLREFGRQAVERQVPEGWRIASRQEGPDSDRHARHILLRRAGGGPAEILVTLIPVKDDRDASVGRPRGLMRIDFPRETSRGATVWAVVLEAGPEVWFVPADVVGSDELQAQSVTAIARAHGLGVLADAMAKTATGGGRMA